MTEPKYCLKCGNALSTEEFITSIASGGLFTTSTVSQPLFWCTNRECSRYGLLSIIRHNKPKKKKK